MAIDKLTVIERQARPRAIAKEKDGVVLYWVEELQVAGIHVRGIMALLGVENSLVSDTVSALERDTGIELLEAETLTPGGVQGVRLVTENNLGEVLEAISVSKAKVETRKKAISILKKLSAAGFKLLVMLELAPHQLKAQVDQHVSEADKLLEIERLRNDTKRLDVEAMRLNCDAYTMHGQAWLALQGVGVAETKIPVTEVVNPATGDSVEILTAPQLKRLIKERTGQNLKSLTAFTDSLRAAGRDDLLVAVTRNNTSEYPIPDRIDEAIAIVYGTNRQTLIGE